MIVSPLNNLILKVSPKYIADYPIIMRAANLNPANTLNPADLVNIVGEIVSLPLFIKHKMGWEGFTTNDMEVGDKVIMRYDVVFNLQENPDSEVPLYKNMIYYKQQELWLADIVKIFAVIKKDTQSIKMVNGYVMLQDIEEESRIYLPQSGKRMMRAKEATVQYIGKNVEGAKMIEAFPGDRVLVHPTKIQHYQINEKKFAIIRQQDIFGRVLK
jgi:co-chaperonin GroES (HSP10)